MTEHQNNDDDGDNEKTESEDSQTDNRKAIAEVIENQTFNFSLFKAFMEWQCKNQLSMPPESEAPEEQCQEISNEVEQQEVMAVAVE